MNYLTLPSLRAEAEQLFEAEEYQRAASLYERLAAANGHDAELLRKLGYCRSKLGQHEPAIEALEQAVARGCPFPWMAQFELAKLCAGLGKKEESLGWLEQALRGRLGGRSRLPEVEAFAAFRDDPRFRQLVGVPDNGEMERDAGWRFDLAYLVEEAQRLHVGLDRPAFSERFLSLASELEAQIPSLSDEQIFVGMQRLIVCLKDGHSSLWPEPAEDLRSCGKHRVRLKMLPLDFYLFDDGLFIVNATTEEGAQWIGAEVHQFGEEPVNNILARLPEYVSADNPMQVKWQGMLTLTLPAFLQALGGASDSSSATLTLRDSENKRHAVTFRAGEPSPRPRLLPSKMSVNPPPLHLQDTTRYFWLKELSDHDAIYIHYRQVRNMDELTLADFAGQLSETIDESEAKHLIVDVRYNSGGNNFLNWPLLRTLIHFDTTSPDNRLFVLIGRNTFSAAQNFVNWLQRTTDAIFVGEPTSSRPNFVGETTEVLLPCSCVRGSISSRMHFDSFWGDERQWIAPHVPVTLSSTDYFDNRDPVLDAVLTMIAAA